MLNLTASSWTNDLVPSVDGLGLSSPEERASFPARAVWAMPPSVAKALGGVIGDTRTNPLWLSTPPAAVPWLRQSMGKVITPAAKSPGTNAVGNGDTVPAEPEDNTTITYGDGTSVSLDQSEMQTIATLERHRKDDEFDLKDLQQKIDDPNTLQDMKEAFKNLQSDTKLSSLLDTALQRQQHDQWRQIGNDPGRALCIKTMFKDMADASIDADGKVSAADIDALGAFDGIKQFNAKQAKLYAANYVSSETTAAATAGRPIDANDAAREFYLYSDNLQDDFDENALRDIADGQLKGDKCPPQLIAAAQFYLDHPDSWQQLTKNGTGKGDVLNEIVSTVYLRPDEDAVLETIGKHRDIFFADNITRDNLRNIINAPGTDVDVRKASQLLLDDPLLFGMLDNGQKGESAGRHNRVNDGLIDESDYEGLLGRLTTRGKSPPAPPPANPPVRPQDQAAVRDMNAGAMDDPDIKKAKGGWAFLDFLKKLGEIVTKIGSAVLHVVSTALSFLGKLPVIGVIASGLSVVAEGAAGALNVAGTALTGGNVKAAVKEMGIGVAGAALGALLPGAGRLLMKGVTGIVAKVADTAVGRAVAGSMQTVSDRIVTPAATAVGEAAAKVTAPIVRNAQRAVSGVRRLGGQAAAGKSTLAKAYAIATTPLYKASQAVIDARQKLLTGIETLQLQLATPFDAAGQRIRTAASRVGLAMGAPFNRTGQQLAASAEWMTRRETLADSLRFRGRLLAAGFLSVKDIAARMTRMQALKIFMNSQRWSQSTGENAQPAQPPSVPQSVSDPVRPAN